MQTPLNRRSICGARTRVGGQCKARVVKGKSKCRMHGGLSTGPKSAVGRFAALWNLKCYRSRFANYGEFCEFFQIKELGELKQTETVL